MSEQEQIKKAVAEAEKTAEIEKQEEFIKKIKDIVQKYLERISDQKKKIAEFNEKEKEKLKVLEKDLDDLRAGRLDKIEERQKVDEKAKETSLIIVERIVKEYIPYYPWRCPWQIIYNTPWWSEVQLPFIGNALGLSDSNKYYCGNTGNGINSGTVMNALQCGTNLAGTDTAVSNMLEQLTATGTAFQNFSGGSYQVDGRIISLS